MSNDLKLSERLRVAIALGQTITLPRDTALAVMKVVENSERHHSAIQALKANMEAATRRRDDAMFRMVRDIAVVCVALAGLGWAL